MIELGLGIGGLLLSLVTYALGVRSGKQTERAIRMDVASIPDRTAEVVTSVLQQVSDPPRPDDPDRGWKAQYAATFGYAPVLPRTADNALLIEFPYGAHSAVLLALKDDGVHDHKLRLLGIASNGTGARFHVRETSDGSGQEVVTLDCVKPWREDRCFAEMPTQPVYYRLLGDDGFREVGRGEVYDSLESPWAIPRAVEPFLDPEWVRRQGH